MPSVTGLSIAQQAYEQLGVIQPGDTPSTTLKANALDALNGMLSSISAEQYSVFTQTFQTFSLVSGQPAYTLGVGGTMGTASRAQKAVAWSASSGNFRVSGPVLSFPEFQTQAQDPLGSTATLPRIVGADEAYPLINLRVHPVPSATPGNIEIAYWTPVSQFVLITDTITVPEGWYQMLWSNLAVILYPKYARVGGLPPELAAIAQNSKAALVQQNSPAQVAAQ